MKQAPSPFHPPPPFSARCWTRAWEQDEQHRGQQPRLLLQGLRHRDCVISSLSRMVAPPLGICLVRLPSVSSPSTASRLGGSVLKSESRGCSYQGAEAR